MTADVEGMITYEKLVDETLRYGLLPAVVPQLKTITLGGAVSGLGIESSSFQFGLVHETVEAMEILTGDGGIVACSACRGIPICFSDFPTPTARSAMPCGSPSGWFPRSLTSTSRTPGSRRRGLLCATRERLRTGFRRLSGRDHLLAGTKCTSRRRFLGRGADGERLHLHGYLLPVHPAQAETGLRLKTTSGDGTPTGSGAPSILACRSRPSALFAKPALNSRTYQRIMRLSQKLLPASPAVRESVIQDVDIPIARGRGILRFSAPRDRDLCRYGCVRSRPRIRTYDLCPLQPNQLYVNFGFWDMIATTRENGYFNRTIERKIAELGGAKGLYSTSYYDREMFWSIYDKVRYDHLKTDVRSRRGLPGPLCKMCRTEVRRCTSCCRFMRFWFICFWRWRFH